MKFIVKILALLFLIVSCSGSKDPQKTTRDFEEYLSSLDLLSTPLSHNPRTNFPALSSNYNTKGFDKYKHTWASRPLGIYYSDDEIVGLIDVSTGDWGPAPLLTTFDMSGNKLDSTSLYNKTGEDRVYKAIEYIQFKKDKIVVLDTVKRWIYNEEDKESLSDSLNTTFGRTEYIILQNGKIKKTEK